MLWRGDDCHRTVVRNSQPQVSHAHQCRTSFVLTCCDFVAAIIKSWHCGQNTLVTLWGATANAGAVPWYFMRRPSLSPAVTPSTPPSEKHAVHIRRQQGATKKVGWNMTSAQHRNSCCRRHAAKHSLLSSSRRNAQRALCRSQCGRSACQLMQPMRIVRRSLRCRWIDGGPFCCNDHPGAVGERKQVWASPTNGCATQVMWSIRPLARGAFDLLLKQYRSERGRPARCVFARATSTVGVA